jgi:hypothetical protein
VILFRPEHRAPILEGRKTQTRRLGRKRWNVGAVHQARTRMMDAGSAFGHLGILAVRREPVVEIDKADAHAEGYDSCESYLEAFARINGIDEVPPDLEAWVVRFELAQMGA